MTQGKQITFWSPFHGQTCTTTGVGVVASAVGVFYRNLSALIGNTNYYMSTLEKIFAATNGIGAHFGLNEIGIDALGMMSRNYGLTRDDIKNNTKQLTKKLELLFGTNFDTNVLNTEESAKSMSDTFPKIFELAKTCYDVSFIDAHSGTINALTKKIIAESDLTVVCLNQNKYVLDEFFSKRVWLEELENVPQIMLLGNYDKNIGMTVKNIQRQYKANEFVTVEYSALLRNACNTGKCFDFFLRNAAVNKNDEVYSFINSVKQTAKTILLAAGISKERLGTAEGST